MTERTDGQGTTLEAEPAGVGRPVPVASPGAAAAKTAVAPARATTRRRAARAVLKGLANVVFMALVIYVTYLFTMSFSTRRPAPAPVPESTRVAAKKIEELRAEERRLLTTYGPVNPATQSVRLPIDRAMELVAAEATRPAPAAAIPSTLAPRLAAPAPAATPKAVAATTSKAATVSPSPAPATTPAVATASPPPLTAPAPAPTRVGMAPEQMYRAICIACHDVDGKGTLVRKAMPTIPDFTDLKWHASRTDADLQNSILVGKGQLMLAMKDKLDLGHTDVKDMVAFIRAFRPGQAGATVASTAVAPAMSVAPVTAAAPAAAPATTGAAPAIAAMPAGPSVPPVALTLPAAPVSTSTVAPISTVPSPLPAVAPTLPAALAVNLPAAAVTPARAAKLRAAGEFYSINCLACHGQDGRGTAIRPAMPVIPDFTSRDWHMTHDNPLLAVSILDGKGALMPPWRGKVDPALAQDLVAFIRGFGPADLASAVAPASEFGNRIRQLRQQWQDLDRQATTLSGR